MTAIKNLDRDDKQSLVQSLKNKAVEKGLGKDICAVTGCGKHDTEVVRIRALDPVDHEDTVVHLCDEHQSWAEERNKLATAVTDELRKARKEIGQEYLDEIAALAEPDAGTSRELLMGDDSAIDSELEGETQ